MDPDTKKLLKELWKYNPIFPIPREDQKRYFDMAVEATERITPQIEDKTGVELGKVDVKRYSHYTKDKFNRAKESTKKLNLEKYEKIIFDSILALTVPLITLRDFLESNKYLAAYDNSNIYIPMNSATKYVLRMDVLENDLQGEMDQMITHELTHHLWEKTPGRIDQHKTPSIWLEGFAVYGEYSWFGEFNSGKEGNPSIERITKGYQRGLEIITNIVSEEGPEIALEIPRRWKEFERRGY